MKSILRGPGHLENATLDNDQNFFFNKILTQHLIVMALH